MYKPLPHQFSLLSLLAGTSIASLFCTSFVLYGIVGLALCAIAFFLAVTAYKSNNEYLRYSLLILAGVASWTLIVHRVAVELYCPSCGKGIAQERVELLTIPYTWNEYHSPSLVTLVARDFGCPCPHHDMEEVGVTRDDYWGMLYCVQPFLGTGRVFASREPWYNEFVQPSVFRIREEQPDLVKDFRERVIQKHDREFWVEFINDITATQPLGE